MTASSCGRMKLKLSFKQKETRQNENFIANKHKRNISIELIIDNSLRKIGYKKSRYSVSGRFR